MRAVIQKVASASVMVDGDTIGSIGKGLLILLGIKNTDTNQDTDYIVDKTVNLRIFEDSEDKLNLSLNDVKGEILIISQFTLYADCKKGRRPSFTEAAPPEIAKQIYDDTVKKFEQTGLKVETGKFQALMKVNLLNDGPVTIILDTNK